MGGFCLPAVSFVLFTIGTSSAHSCNPQMLCQSDWEQWSGSCYKLTEDKLPWDEARLKCQDMGGEMAAPSSIEENNYILSKNNYRLWINCNDLKTEGQWECVSDNSSYVNWNSREPGGGTEENCAMIALDSGAGWLDARCSQNVLTLCKGKQIIADQAKLQQWRLLASCLNGHTLRELPTSSVIACATMCDYDLSCRSFNVQHNGTGENMCQLNNATRFDADHTQFGKMKRSAMCIYGEK